MNLTLYTAATCGPCKLAKPLIVEICEQKGIQLTLKTAEDNREELLKYSRSVPYLIATNNGEVIGQAIPSTHRQQVLELIQSWLNKCTSRGLY